MLKKKLKRKFTTSPPNRRWKEKPYKCPIKLHGPTRWETTKVERNGKIYEIRNLVRC